MMVILQHRALNSRALAASDKYSKSNSPRLPRGTPTAPKPCQTDARVYLGTSLEDETVREQIGVNEWYSGEGNDGLIKGPRASLCLRRTPREVKVALRGWCCWQTDWACMGEHVYFCEGRHLWPRGRCGFYLARSFPIVLGGQVAGAVCRIMAWLFCTKQLLFQTLTLGEREKSELQNQPKDTFVLICLNSHLRLGYTWFTIVYCDFHTN